MHTFLEYLGAATIWVTLIGIYLVQFGAIEIRFKNIWRK